MICKYTLPLLPARFDLAVPFGAQLLACQLQRGVPVLWAEVTPSNDKRIWRLEWFGTGHEIRNARGHVATVQIQEDPPLVLHLYEVFE